MLRVLMIAFVFLGWPTGSLAQSGAQADSGRDLGEIDFPTSGSPEAHKHFIRGVLWLHSFEYPEAREAFQKAQEAEPGFAMAIGAKP